MLELSWKQILLLVFLIKHQQINSGIAEVKLETAWSMASATEIKQESIEFDVEKTEVKLENDLKTGWFYKKYQS